MTALLQLAERCEAASGPDRSIDKAIAWGGARIHEEDTAPRYTASLDAAMTLVPDGAGFDLRRCVGGLGIVSVYPRGFTKSVIEIRAQTTALALCAAALRARASQEAAK